MTDISEVSFKDKYDQVYENYLNNISSVAGFKNRSKGMEGILHSGEGQNSFSYPVKHEKMPPILRSENHTPEYNKNITKSAKVNKGPGYKKTPVLVKKKDVAGSMPNARGLTRKRKQDIVKYFTPTKGTNKV